MKLYNELTPAGIKRRFRKVAELALLQYDIRYSTVEFYTEDTNVFFKVFGTDGIWT
ncbi:MAG: hypothetical protein KAQ68_10575 [Clostridiales bacterium]|nr:hypothetical protein [Clostridiales bacterium]